MAFALCAFLPLLASALGPHEVAVVANDESMDSVLLAKAFMRIRDIPESNLVRVHVPVDEDGAAPIAITKDDFKALIFDPVERQLREAGLSQQILAWVYSCGLPVRVTADGNAARASGTKDLSITGATFVRGSWPEDTAVERGEFRSVLFAGPAGDGAPPRGARSLDQERNLVLGAMPLPSCMLAFTGPRGMSVDEAIEMLEASVGSDHRAPRSVFWIAKNDDVRSTCREWEYPSAAEAIKNHPGMYVAVSTNQPGPTTGPIFGYMTGAQSAKAPARLAPGSYADHLTSFAATFDAPSQMKATQWLRKGASFTSGTVAEPYAIWQKFPSAWIFPWMLDGLSAIEAFYAAVACPLQILPLGDPLSKPFAPLLEPDIEGPDDGAKVNGMVELGAIPPKAAEGASQRFTWLLDGKPLGTGRSLLWHTENIPDGVHTIRLVVRQQTADGPRHQGFAERTFRVKNGGKK